MPRDSFELPSLAEPSDLGPSIPHMRLRRNDVAPRHWNNRYLAWQARERSQRDEKTRLMAEQRRIFGGDGTEEDDLIVPMLDFFAGLEYLD